MEVLSRTSFATYKNHRAEPYFTFVKNGQKTVEGRLKKEEYANLKPGDHIVVFNKAETDSVEVVVSAVREYPTFQAMLDKEVLKEILPDVETVEQGVAVYRQFYTSAQEAACGVLACEFERVVEQGNIAKTSKFWAGAILYHPEKQSILLQHRDSAAPVHPNQWGLFGGVGEVGELPEECLRRELQEELGIDFSQYIFSPLRDFLIERIGTWRYVFWTEFRMEKNAMRLAEGAGFEWVPLTEVLKLDLAGAATRGDIELFLQNKQGI